MMVASALKAIQPGIVLRHLHRPFGRVQFR